MRYYPAQEQTVGEAGGKPLPALEPKTRAVIVKVDSRGIKAFFVANSIADEWKDQYRQWATATGEGKDRQDGWNTKKAFWYVAPQARYIQARSAVVSCEQAPCPVFAPCSDHSKRCAA